MALSDYLKFGNPDDLDAILAKAVKEASEAALKAKFADDAYKEALSAEDDTADGKARAFADKLEKEYQAARRELMKKTARLDRVQARVDEAEGEAKARALEAEEAARKAALEGPWNRAVELAEERQALFIKAQASMQSLADQIRGIVKITGELDMALPKVFGGNKSGALLPENDLLNKIRLEMTRLGLNGEMLARSVYDQDPLLKTAEGIPAMIKNWRTRALAGE